MNLLKFDIEPSFESNDHQVRVIIDEVDFLGHNYLGIDPAEFFHQKALFSDGNLLIGRCGCGCVGCDDIWTSVNFFDEEIVWLINKKSQFSFNRRDYSKLINEASLDFSWEDSGRTAERLVSEIFDGKMIEGNYLFDWASTRIESNIIKLSFSKNGEQKLYQFSWDGETTDSAIKNALLFYRKNFE